MSWFAVSFLSFLQDVTVSVTHGVFKLFKVKLETALSAFLVREFQTKELIRLSKNSVLNLVSQYKTGSSGVLVIPE